MRGAMRDDGVEICADAMNASMKRQHARGMENTQVCLNRLRRIMDAWP